MAKKNKAIMQIEVLRPVRAEAMVRRDDLIFQPFFASRKVFDAIRRLQTVPEQRAWSDVFKKHGCIACGRKDVRHNSCGCCSACYTRILTWKTEAIRGIEEHLLEPPPIRDYMEIARAALSGPHRPALTAAPDTKRSSRRKLSTRR
jgi:hypothetical protein